MHELSKEWIDRQRQMSNKDKKRSTWFTVGSVGRRDLGADGSSTNEHRQSQTAGDGAAVIFLDSLLLRTADNLGGLDVRHVALRWWCSCWCSRECMVVQEALSWSHFFFSLSSFFFFFRSLKASLTIIKVIRKKNHSYVDFVICEGQLDGFWILDDERRLDFDVG